MVSRKTTWLFLALAAAGCADTLTPGDDPPPPESSGAFTHDTGVDGVTTTLVDATDAEAWQHLDLDTGAAVERDGDWELGFLRFRIRLNGGLTGDGGVFVTEMDGTFEEVSQAPDTGWSTDGPDGEADDDTEPDNLFNNGSDDWYDYELETHTLSPRPRVYCIASTERRYFKLELLAYYDEAGSPGFVRFRWAEVLAPEAPVFPGDVPVDPPEPPPVDPGPEIPADALAVPANDPSSWVYVSATGGIVTPASPQSSLEWDLAFRRTDIRTNSGTSGPGFAGAREAPAEDLTEATTFGYAVDEVVEGDRPGAAPTSLNPALSRWYDYDPALHAVTPKEQSFLLRTADGGYARMRIWHWDDGTFHVTFDALPRTVELRTLTVDASMAGEWTHVSLRAGEVQNELAGDPSTDLDWDVAFSRTMLRTNGGSSGTGDGEAVEQALASLSELATLPADGWVYDAPMAPAGPPGAPEVSQNAALSSWFDYDPATHTVSPRSVIYGVRTADGQLGALRVVSYAGGVYEVEVAFAGAGMDRF